MRKVKDGKYRVVGQFQGALPWSVFYQNPKGFELVGAFTSRDLARMYAKDMNNLLSQVGKMVKEKASE